MTGFVLAPGLQAWINAVLEMQRMTLSQRRDWMHKLQQRIYREDEMRRRALKSMWVWNWRS